MYDKQPDFTTHDYVIGGKMVVGKATLDESYSIRMNTDLDARMEVKKKLVQDMVQFILENKLVEFTQMDDPITYTKMVAIRAYLAPDDQVRILRLANKIV